jgi:tRNA modification GTPase
LWELSARSDDPAAPAKASPRHRLSVHSGEGLGALRTDLVAHARASLPVPGEAALNARQHGLLAQVRAALLGSCAEQDPLLAAEQLRLARRALDTLVGRAGTEDMLDALFGRFCIGK